MIAVALVISLAAALLLFTGGYLFGARRGAVAREHLREQTLLQARQIDSLREEMAGTFVEREESLRATIERALQPLVEREQFALELSQLKSGASERRDLGDLLNKIAEAGNFTAVVLGDADGLALAANAMVRDAERIAAISSLVFLIADRISAADLPQPLSVMIRDEADRTTLCRVFEVQGQRMTLTAVATGQSRLTPSALDPALVKVASVLANAA
jgi:predicted regulator of Ras-like GTPase activity (Roadblock/LC7/MglB family)